MAVAEFQGFTLVLWTFLLFLVLMFGFGWFRDLQIGDYLFLNCFPPIPLPTGVRKASWKTQSSFTSHRPCPPDLSLPHQPTSCWKCFLCCVLCLWFRSLRASPGTGKAPNYMTDWFTSPALGTVANSILREPSSSLSVHSDPQLSVHTPVGAGALCRL